jgi:hypothetical protein
MNFKVLCIPLLVLSVTSRALAQSAGDMETGRALYTDAHADQDAGRLPEALEKYKGAFAIAPTPLTGIDLAKLYIQLGQLLEGREVLLAVARLKPKPTESERGKAARVEAEALAEQVRARIPSMILEFAPALLSADREALRLTIDGVPIPTELVGLERKSNPGTHQIIARLGSGEVRKSVTLREGESSRVVLELASPAGADPAGGSQSGSPSKPLMYLGFGLAGAGLVLGTVAGVVAFGKADSISSYCTGTSCQPAAQPIVSSGRTWATVSTVSFIGAALGAGIGVVGILLAKPQPKKPQTATAALQVGLGDVALVGQF